MLSSGGARGYAHIGAIEALEARGYRIASVTGTSMGALVGGMYCAGRLPQLKEWLYSLTRRDIIALLDLSLGKNYVVKGEKLIGTLQSMAPEVNIEALPIPFRVVAADLATQREVVFTKGSLYRAIRSSISMPSVFKPIKVAHHLLVDGGIVNPLPLNRAVRSEGDLLVSINVSAPASEAVEEMREMARRKERDMQGLLSLQRVFSKFVSDNAASNYMTLLSSAIALQIQRNTVLSQKLTPPDIAVNIPMNRFGVFQFEQARHITRVGFKEMNKALDVYEATQEQ